MTPTHDFGHNTTNGTTIRFRLYGVVSQERLAMENALCVYRADQMSPHAKSMEYQRALEEDKE